MTEATRTRIVGRETYADEWAMRSGMVLADRHMPDAKTEARFALASDIAEALTLVRRSALEEEGKRDG